MVKSTTASVDRRAPHGGVGGSRPWVWAQGHEQSHEGTTAPIAQAEARDAWDLRWGYTQEVNTE